MGDIYDKLSSGLYQVLDIIGASEDERTQCKEVILTEELLMTAESTDDLSFYYFGSRFEGTTTSGLNSDIDVLYCRPEEPVVENIEDAPRQGISYLMITDNNTMPGYFNLQIVQNGVPNTIFQREIHTEIYEDTDYHGRILRKHVYFKIPALPVRNGPAQTTISENGHVTTDLVFSFICRNVPVKANFWLRKDRTGNWPSNTQLQRMSKYGCFFVGVGHPHSENQSTEWRISFSLQERELMSSLNPTQHKCYILLKMIKKDIIQPRAGEKSISSYHCKTSLFYVLENSRPGLWTRRNLIQGVRACLAVLLSWVKRGNCPNFFIPEENMFDRLNQDILDQVATVLTDILKSGAKFLLVINCDDVGVNIIRYLSGDSLAQIRSIANSDFRLHLFSNASAEIYRTRNSLLMRAGNTSIKIQCIIEIVSVIQRLKNTKLSRDYRTDEIDFVIKTFVPHMYLQIAQSIASDVSTNPGIDPTVNISRFFRYCIHKGEDCDLISCKLMLATCYLRADLWGKCEETLSTCEVLMKDFVISLCGCSFFDIYKNESLLKEMGSGLLSSIDFRRKYTTGCLLFLPSQANLVHPALQLEMHRSVYTPPGSRDKDWDYWYDWILVDSRVYLYFLQYLLYSKTNKYPNKKDAIDNIVQLVYTDENIGHRETAFNLLGWMYIQENKMKKAFRCFQESWKIRPVHNAAKFHLVVMLSKFSHLFQR